MPPLTSRQPASFLNHPTFKKNCDLICIHHLNKLAEFKNHEEQIFAIEEESITSQKVYFGTTATPKTPRLKIIPNADIVENYLGQEPVQRL